MIRNAVPAFGGADDRAALLYDLGSGGHAFHRLVKILIEWVAGVRGDDDIERLIDATHCVFARQQACGTMFLKQISSESCSDLLIAIECDIERKVHSGHARDLTHVVMNGIAFGDSPCCPGMA